VITGHFHAKQRTRIFLLGNDANDCKVKVVGDVSCDIDGPVACTLRPSTIAELLYGYLPSQHAEVDIFHPAAIVVMAVGNFTLMNCLMPV
jgi:hypothetical protein